MTRKAVVKIILIVAVLAALLIGFRMMQGKAATVTSPVS